MNQDSIKKLAFVIFLKIAIMTYIASAITLKLPVRELAIGLG